MATIAGPRVARVGRIIGAVVATAVVGYGVVVAMSGEEDSSCDGFDLEEAGERWRSAGAGGRELSERQPIADTLIRCRALQGMSRRAVIRALGPPRDREPGFLHYITGGERGQFPIDDEWLIVEFDSRSRVSNVVLEVP